MSQKKKIAIDIQEFEEKRYEIAKDILASTLSGGNVENTTELKQRESLIFNCVQMAEMLLNELGYTPQVRSSDMSIHTLSKILKTSSLKNED